MSDISAAQIESRDVKDGMKFQSSVYCVKTRADTAITSL